jgi:hypothetical protein
MPELPKKGVEYKDLKKVSWFKAQKTSNQIFVMTKDHDFLKKFNGAEIRLRESSFNSYQGVRPQVVELKYDFLDCPSHIRGFNEDLLEVINDTEYKIGEIQFTNLRLAGCGFSILLKSNFFDRDSIFGVLKNSR